VLTHHSSYCAQFDRMEAMIIRQRRRVEPEFADAAIPLHMHVPRFIAVKTVKKQPVRAKRSSNGWHGVPSPRDSRALRVSHRLDNPLRFDADGRDAH